MNQFNVSLWGDEAFSAILSMKPVSEIISIVSRDTSPPLYNLTEHFWFLIFGTSEVAIRSLSFIYFLLAIFFVFKIGEYLWGKKTGLLAATLTFLNPFFFTYAFEGRMYSILALGVTASMYFFIKIYFSKNPSKFDALGYILATTWALYSHHFAIFAVLVQGLWFLVSIFKGKKKIALTLLKSFIVVGILYSPWLIPLYNQTKMVGGGFWLGKPTVLDLFILVGKFLAVGIKVNFAFIALLFVLGVLFLRDWAKDIEKTTILVSWFLFPVMFTWLISQKFTSIFFDRYLLYVIPAAMLILSSNLKKVSIFLVLILIGLLLIVDFNYFTHPTKRPFRELATYVKEVKRGDDYLINWNSAAHHLWESKYYGIPAPIYIPGKANLPYFVGTALMTKDDIIGSLPKKVYRVGVITSGPIEEVSLPGYTRLDYKTFGVLKFIWFKK